MGSPQTNPSPKVGFCGLGRMGLAMAQNLAAAGFDLSVWNRSESVAADFSERHQTGIARNLSELAAKSDIVLTMLADDSAVKSVYLDPHGLLSADHLPHTVCEMGTISPALAKTLADAAARNGTIFVDAPVSGSVQAASDSNLLIMAGADQDANVKLANVFAALGKRTIWLQHPGRGSAMKLAVNMLIHGLNQTLSEALMVAEGAGIDPTVAYEVIENSAAAAPMLHYRKALYLDETSQPVSFSTELAAKDVVLALDLASAGDFTPPQAALNLALLREAIERGFGQRDMAAMLNFMRERGE